MEGLAAKGANNRLSEIGARAGEGGKRGDWRMTMQLASGQSGVEGANC